MQRMTVKTRNPETGAEEVKTLTVLRSWSDGDRQVWHHVLPKGGHVYGYKDGAPVRTLDELEIIGDPRQYQAALAWWEGQGREMARLHYGDEDAAGTRSRSVDAMYHRFPRGDRPDPLPGAQVWSAWFSSRPPWWGLAETITIDGMVYERQSPSWDGAEDPPQPKKAKGKSAADSGLGF